ncbi:flavin reductase family protein [Halobacterium litoreum]|uniref:Flavin reductase family protein n=1 Tax=Halobacterium litoreum TaxID=2039234 RepID=A0ABD5NGZ2_9EURY|nr:flavin reductase family protein [Halobacterium litoreum]UHH12632.1 flavin reductase family protein [Halobacterium litoreum]
MELDPAETGMYRTLSGAMVPRPIAWVSSVSEDGHDNLAPFSFSTVAAIDPPTLLFAPTDLEKDTPRNVRETGEFVVNVVTEDVVEAMNETSATCPPDVSEFDHAGVERADSRKIDAPRVAESPVNFECRLADTVEVGSSVLVLGEVVWVHADDDVTTDGKLDTNKLDAVGRMAGSEYAYTRERFSLERPD